MVESNLRVAQVSGQNLSLEEKLNAHALAVLFFTAEVTAYHQHHLGFKVDLKIIFHASMYVLVEAIRISKEFLYSAPTLTVVKHNLRSSVLTAHRFYNFLTKLDQIKEEEKRTALFKEYLERLPEHEDQLQYISPHLEKLCFSYIQDQFDGHGGFQKHTLDRLKRALLKRLGSALSEVTHMERGTLNEFPAEYFVMSLIKLTGYYGGYSAALLKKDPNTFLKKGLKFFDECTKEPSLFTVTDNLLPPGHA